MKLALLAVAVLFSVPARAQFTGFSAPQPTTSNPFTNTPCTGSPQVAVVPNFAQTEHFITVTTSGAQKQEEIPSRANRAIHLRSNAHICHRQERRT